MLWCHRSKIHSLSLLIITVILHVLAAVGVAAAAHHRIDLLHWVCTTVGSLCWTRDSCSKRLGSLWTWSRATVLEGAGPSEAGWAPMKDWSCGVVAHGSCGEEQLCVFIVAVDYWTHPCPKQQQNDIENTKMSGLAWTNGAVCSNVSLQVCTHRMLYRTTRHIKYRYSLLRLRTLEEELLELFAVAESLFAKRFKPMVLHQLQCTSDGWPKLKTYTRRLTWRTTGSKRFCK